MTDPTQYRHAEIIEYDTEAGVLSTHSEFFREEVEVRARLQEDILRQAVILELEKLGYTVIRPEGKS